MFMIATLAQAITKMAKLLKPILPPSAYNVNYKDLYTVWKIASASETSLVCLLHLIFSHKCNLPKRQLHVI